MMKNTPDSPKKGPIHVAGYVRVSDNKQAMKEDGSIDTQYDLIARFCEFKCGNGDDWRLTEKLIEGEQDGKRRGKSGKNTKRPAYQKLLALAQARMIDVVVVTRLERISRNVADFLQLVATLEQYDVKLVSLRENIDLTTPGGRLITVVFMALAQYEREMTSARVRDKVLWRVEKGLPIGPPPIGMKMVGKLFGPAEPHIAHVKAAEALYLELQSVDKLVREFRERGYRTPSGKFYMKPVLCRMLRNTVYAAKQEHHGQLFDAQWKPIRSWETHQKIQAMMDKNDRRHHSDKRQPREYVYLLQGLLRCGRCGHKMSPKPGKGRSGEYYHYYHCVAAEKSAGMACPKRYAPAEALDGVVLEFLKQLHLKPERIRAAGEKANESTSVTLSKLRTDLERVKTQLASVRSKLGRLVDILTEGGKDAMASVRERMQALEAERLELETTEARLKAELAAEQTQEIVAADQIKALELFNQIVKANVDKPDRIKAIIPRFVDYVILHEEKKGEGQLEVAIFGDPVALAPEVEWPNGEPGDSPGFAGASQVVGRAGFEPTAKAI